MPFFLLLFLPLYLRDFGSLSSQVSTQLSLSKAEFDLPQLRFWTWFVLLETLSSC